MVAYFFLMPVVGERDYIKARNLNADFQATQILTDSKSGTTDHLKVISFARFILCRTK